MYDDREFKTKLLEHESVPGVFDGKSDTSHSGSELDDSGLLLQSEHPDSDLSDSGTFLKMQPASHAVLLCRMEQGKISDVSQGDKIDGSFEQILTTFSPWS